MQPLKPHQPRLYFPNSQAGFSLILLALVLLIGFGTLLVFALNGSQARIERDKVTADALALAKDALIGISVTYPDLPGSLPCPDTDDDGTSDAGGSTECPRYIGRLPWKTLGLPDLRDAAGERLWYTLSRNVRRYDLVRPLNSETIGTLNITGTYTANNLMAIVFAPGATIGSQSRSNSQTAFCTTTSDSQNESLCAVNYLEGSNANPSPGSSPNQDYQNANAGVPFNDQLISISHDQLFRAVEMRIAREAKSCLDEYAAMPVSTNGNLPSLKYPWAAPVSDTSYTGTYNTFFGRLSTMPSNATSGSPDSSMSTAWPSSCTLFTSSYWPDWKDQVFYQVASGYEPGGSGSCTTGTCLTINSSGAYRAVVVVAGRALTPRNLTATPPSTYLEGFNPHTATSPSIKFETYPLSSSSHQSVNDLVLCLNNCM